MSRWIWRNFSAIGLSLVLAFFFWAVATESENPTRRDAFSMLIPVEVEGVPEGMIAYGYEGSRVRVRLVAPESVWLELRSEHIKAYVDVSDVTTGTVSLPVRVDIALNPAMVLSTSPEVVELTLERFAQKEVPVAIKITGTPVVGYKADAPVSAPQVARVQGPASMVARVVQALIIADIQGQQSDLRTDFVPVPVDENENAVTQVEVVPKTVTVSVPIWQLGYIRDLAVTVTLEGQPAPGYRVANLLVDPPVVKVVGRTDLVKAAQYLQTRSISLEGITQTLESRAVLQMPEGLSVIFPPTPEVTVTLTVEVIRSGLTLDVSPEIQGLSPGLAARAGIDSVVVILSGPLIAMEQVNPADVRLILDLTNLTTGDYIITPKVLVPEQVVIENIVPEAVPVTIERAVPSDDGFE